MSRSLRHWPRHSESRCNIKWIDVHRETAIGELLEHECDLAFGAAIDPQAMDDEEELAGKVIYSRPYYGTGYFLVARAGCSPRIKALTELQGENVASAGHAGGHDRAIGTGHGLWAMRARAAICARSRPSTYSIAR